MLENITLFTEVDPGGDFTQTINRNTVDTLRASLVSYVYKDYGSGYFSGDFKHYINSKLTQYSGNTRCGIYALSNYLKSHIDLHLNGIFLYFYNAGDSLKIWLTDKGNDNSDSSFTISLDTDYYFNIERIGSVCTVKIYTSESDRESDTNIFDTLTITCQSISYQYGYVAFNNGDNIYAFRSWYSENLDFSVPVILQSIQSDSLILSDDIEINLSLEKKLLEDTLIIEDSAVFGHDDNLPLSDDIETMLIRTVDIDNDFRSVIETKADVNNKFNSAIRVLSNLLNKIDTVIGVKKIINNKYNSVIGVIKSINNIFNSVNGKIINLYNDYRTKKLENINIKNDFRMLKSWQIAGDAGFQSLGKEYVKIYIDDIEQTDAIVDSVTISKSLNSTHTTSFELGRAYDSFKPNKKAIVKIKYDNYLLYKGYIINVEPSSDPESIKIFCKDKYWERNYINKYFSVGHEPQDNKEIYFNTIKEGLNDCNFNVDIGNFVPQTISCFGNGESDCISSLINASGNFDWFYDVNDNKKLKIAGQGDIINISPQKIGSNIKLHDVLSHNIMTSIDDIVNKFRVQMGDKVIRYFSDSGGKKEYSSYYYDSFKGQAIPNWDTAYESLSTLSSNGYGWDRPQPGKEYKYNSVFKKYKLPYLDPELESWTDRYPPQVQIIIPFGLSSYTLEANENTEFVEGFSLDYYALTEGFTIDYKSKILTLNNPVFLYEEDSYGEITSIRRPIIRLALWKKNYASDTESQSENPESDISNPLLFFTEKMGDYSETIIKPLSLTNFSIQGGGSYYDSDGKSISVPSWDDTIFAKDYANWQLSQNCDESEEGSVEITLDTFCFYNIDLTKRIYIEGVTQNPLNIQSISINLSNFTVNLNLKKERYYKRTVSLSSHGL